MRNLAEKLTEHDMNKAALDVTGVNQFYGQSHTLWDAGVVVPPGACVCLMGRNGVGKTTLLESDHGPSVAHVRERFGLASKRLRMGDPNCARGWASATCRRGARFFRS